MSGTTKTVLIVGVAAIGVYLVWQSNAPRRTAAGPTYTNPLYALAPAVGSGLGALFKSISSSSSTSPSTSTSSNAPPTTFDTPEQQDYAIKHDVVIDEGNYSIDANTGNAIVYGTN